MSCDVILITADKSIDAVQEAFRYGAVDYLIKPFTFERFRAALLKYQKQREGFERLSEVGQNAIDKYVFVARNEETQSSDLVKGLNVQTYDQIWSVINEWESGYFTAEEIAEKLGMARVTVRRYMEYMQKEDRLEIQLEYGKVGRPQHRYTVKK